MKIVDLSHEHGFDFPRVVATLGFFDGVHLGHRHLIGLVRREAARRGLPSAVITFPVHPREALHADYRPKLLCSYGEKLERLGETGIDYCISLPFTEALSKLTAQAFITDVLVDKLHVDTLFIGYDHRFGHHRAEGFPEYRAYGRAAGLEVVQASEFQAGGRISSSRIRQLLSEGNIREANRLLSYPYTLSGEVVEGYRVGRTIGFPTANLQIREQDKAVPLEGVYAVRVYFRATVRDGMLYIGTRPTLQSGSAISVEVNIFDFEGDLYNERVTVEIIDFIRADARFDSMEALAARIREDRAEVKLRLARYGG